MDAVSSSGEIWLKFAKQFVVAPETASAPDGWLKQDWTSHHWVATHPRLDVARVAKDDVEFICFGQILDPGNPSNTDREVLEHLSKAVRSFDELERELSNFGGRWVIIARIGESSRIYHDATGLKSVFYYSSPESGSPVYLASQPVLFEDVAGLTRDTELEAAFLNAPHWSSWVGTRTPYRDVYQLLPNHYLELETGAVVRYWPRENVAVRSVEDAAPRMLDLLHRIMRAAVARGEATMGLTGGYDSRLLFAAAGDLRENLDFFTVRNETTPRYDIDIPKKLVGNKYAHRIAETQLGDKDVQKILDMNAAGMFFDASKYYFQSLSSGIKNTNKVNISGMVCEICRCYYYGDGKHPVEIDSDYLCDLTHFQSNPIAKEAFDEWLSTIPKNTNVSILDLLYWEHRLGNWGAMGMAYREALSTMLAPMNCRALIEIGLGVPARDRARPHRLFRRIYALSDPRLAAIPLHRGRLTDVLMAIKNRMPPWAVNMVPVWLRKMLR